MQARQQGLTWSDVSLATTPVLIVLARFQNATATALEISNALRACGIGMPSRTVLPLLHRLEYRGLAARLGYVRLRRSYGLSQSYGLSSAGKQEAAGLARIMHMIVYQPIKGADADDFTLDPDEAMGLIGEAPVDSAADSAMVELEPDSFAEAEMSPLRGWK